MVFFGKLFEAEEESRVPPCPIHGQYYLKGRYAYLKTPSQSRTTFDGDDCSDPVELDGDTALSTVFVS